MKLLPESHDWQWNGGVLWNNNHTLSDWISCDFIPFPRHVPTLSMVSDVLSQQSRCNPSLKGVCCSVKCYILENGSTVTPLMSWSKTSLDSCLIYKHGSDSLMSLDMWHNEYNNNNKKSSWITKCVFFYTQKPIIMVIDLCFHNVFRLKLVYLHNEKEGSMSHNLYKISDK